MIPGTRLLMIGEDTGNHINNVYWAFDLDSKQLKRVLTVPKKAEVTSTAWYEFNGRGYLSVVAQHPLDGVTGVSPASQETVLGYVGPFIKN
jgi:hypothetical protein